MRTRFPEGKKVIGPTTWIPGVEYGGAVTVPHEMLVKMGVAEPPRVAGEARRKRES